MTVFAGYIKLNNKSLSDEEYNEFKACFEKCSQASVTYAYKDDRQAFVSVNLLKDDNYIFDDKNQCTLISGQPLVINNGNLKKDITLINSANSEAELKCILNNTRGVFAGATIGKSNENSFVYTDKLGIRPVYFYNYNGLIVFSSLLSLFENLPKVNLSVDNSGISELISFGYCLSDRTQYQYIKRMNSAEFIRISLKDKRVSKSQYWDYSKIPVKKMTDEDIKELYEIYQDSIKIRLDSNKPTIAFLSGGLDSRTITSSLKTFTENVYTYNFGTTKSQDNEFAREYAKAANLCHQEVILSKLSFPNWSQLIADAIDDTEEQECANVNSKIVWSGDGGSVSIGGVYLDENILEACENKKESNLVLDLLSTLKVSLPTKFIIKNKKILFSDLLEKSVSKELHAFPQDKAKVVYHFLMCNDQKRHLERHFETICQHKVELNLPFFDSLFIEKLYSLPVHELKNHNLYMKWFKYFPENSRSTPWQTYPGHVPCPIKNEVELSYQWNRSKPTNETLKEDFNIFLSLLNNVAFKYLDKKKVYLAMLIHRMGIRDYGYLITILKRLDRIKK